MGGVGEKGGRMGRPGQTEGVGLAGRDRTGGRTGGLNQTIKCLLNPTFCFMHSCNLHFETPFQKCFKTFWNILILYQN